MLEVLIDNIFVMFGERIFQLFNKRSTTAATSGAGTVFSFGAPERNPGILWGLCCSIFNFVLFSFGHCIICPTSIYGI